MARNTLYFAYGTLQHGFANYATLAAELGAPLGRYRTGAPYPLVVTTSPACTNPGCRFLHHMCALLHQPGEGAPVEGDMYSISPATVERLDALESYIPGDEARSTYVRRAVRVNGVDGRSSVEAQVYFVAAPERWVELVAAGRAELRSCYTRDLAEGPLKPCCARDPRHEGPHDVVEPA